MAATSRGVNRRHSRALLAPLLAVVALLLGLAGSASAAFNPAATETPYCDFLLWESEASASASLQLADPSMGNGEWVYDCASGVPVYVRQNPWTFFDPLGLERYKGSDASDEDWNKLSDKAREQLKDYRESGGTMKMLEDAGFDPEKEINMSARKVTLSTAGEVEFQMWTQGDKTLYTRDVWGAAEGGGIVEGAGIQGWDNWNEFKYDMNMDAFWRGKGGEAFQRGISVAAGLSGGLARPTTGSVPNGANVAHALGRLKAAQQQASMASVNDKLARYLLNAEHPVGGAKAKFFAQALGYTTENSGALARQLVFNPKTAVQTAVTQHGTKFNQVIDVVGANGRTIPMKTAWIQNNDGVVRLVTAVPAK